MGLILAHSLQMKKLRLSCEANLLIYWHYINKIELSWIESSGEESAAISLFLHLYEIQNIQFWEPDFIYNKSTPPPLKRFVWICLDQTSRASRSAARGKFPKGAPLLHKPPFHLSPLRSAKSSHSFIFSLQAKKQKRILRNQLCLH